MVDSRPKGRFDGTAPEPNPKLCSGHMLGSINLPFTQMIEPSTKTLKDKAGLQQGGLNSYIPTCTIVCDVKDTTTNTYIITPHLHSQSRIKQLVESVSQSNNFFKRKAERLNSLQTYST